MARDWKLNPKKDPVLSRRQASYKFGRTSRMEEMLVKTRGKLKYLIQEAKDLGLTHLLLEDEL